MHLPVRCLLSLLTAMLWLCAWQTRADTVLHVSTDSGRANQPLREYTVTPAAGYAFEVKVDEFHGLFIHVLSGGSYYNLSFDPAAGSALAVGDYFTAVGGAGREAPYLSVSSSDFGNSGSGQFQILELIYDSNGQVLTFAANFAQRWTDNTYVKHNDAVAYGQIRYNSSLPYATPGGNLQLAINKYRVRATDGSVTVTVKRREGSTGRMAVQYATADGTDLAGRDYAPVSGVLVWKDGDTADKSFQVPILNSGDPLQGDGTFLINLGGADAGTQNQAVVTVRNDDSAVTYVHFTCDPDNLVGAGLERTFSFDAGYAFNVTNAAAGGVHFAFNDDRGPQRSYSQSWDLYFYPAKGTALAAGDYPVAGNDPISVGTTTYPQMQLSGWGQASGGSVTHLRIIEVEFNADGTLSKFAADFEEFTVGYMGTSAALVGEVRYRSTLPRPVRTPRISVMDKGLYTMVNSAPGIFEFTRTGDTSRPLKVAYLLSGSAVSGRDFVPLKGKVKFKAGQNTAQVAVTAIGEQGIDRGMILKLSIARSLDYVFGDLSNAEMELETDHVIH